MTSHDASDAQSAKCGLVHGFGRTLGFGILGREVSCEGSLGTKQIHVTGGESWTTI